MKNLLIGLFCLTILAACGGGGTDSGDPGSVAVAFNKALAEGDMEAAKKYSSEESAEWLGMIAGMMAMAPDSVKEANKKREFKVVRDSIVEDRAWVWIEAVGDEGTSEKTELKQEDGEWKVVFSKE